MDRLHTSKYRFTLVLVQIACNVTLNMFEMGRYNGVMSWLFVSLVLCNALKNNSKRAKLSTPAFGL